MHQHTIVGYIIGMIVLDLEVIDLDRAFEQLVLDFFDDNIFAVDQNENIPRPEFAGLCPALDRRIERMSRRCNDFFAVCPDMNQLVRLVDVGFDNLSFCLRRGKSPAETCSLIILLHGTFFTGVYIPEAQLYQFSVPALTKILHGRVLAHRPVSPLCPARKFPILDVKGFPESFFTGFSAFCHFHRWGKFVEDLAHKLINLFPTNGIARSVQIIIGILLIDPGRLKSWVCHKYRSSYPRKPSALCGS